MTTENGKVSTTRRAPQPMALRLLVEGVRPNGGPVDLSLVPSGSSRVAMRQLVQIATLAIERVAKHEGRDPLEVLSAAWAYAEQRPTR